MKVHENFDSFCCFSENAEGDYSYKWAEECIQEGVFHPGFVELRSRKGPEGHSRGEWWAVLFLSHGRESTLPAVERMRWWSSWAWVLGRSVSSFERKGAERFLKDWSLMRLLQYETRRKYPGGYVYPSMSVHTQSEVETDILAFHLNSRLLLCMRQSYKMKRIT